ncbi:Phosphoribosylaminoimidazole-succinocarboxamide synthase [Austwickia sp. TVS 96-490-7B]|uniref:phosphoribosylaminoimidazolesuccinocarboxamide synthase n=1 Tax=Austwickia sp. TVS 96-490-7B TaxID=2830843 RepID=UPI001C574961|nr:phosphoribosylaminoimidazolesuccinocarboxamide synthase [Austwickia sp. TVS 96-490-7B]MBW3085468.1 Phosphoribosylaminoimidazole-succinocarboxamide synthase [Austwickia sp. TVS 96-490-7B]
MSPASTVSAPHLPGYRHLASGKVRDLYVPVDPTTGEEVPDQLLLVASDRISAYDFVLDSVIPDKGIVLTQLSLWWFEQLADLVPHHVLSTEVPAQVAGRAVLVRRLEMLPVECIARAYLTGSGLAEYQVSGSVCGVSLPPGLGEASALEMPIFTPTSKAAVGAHDAPMTAAEVAELIGPHTAARVAELTTGILSLAGRIAAPRGILIADTKVEYGVAPDGTVMLADEVLTPDSSRFWPAADYCPGQPQRSYDKQYVRDWLTSPASGWDRRSGHTPPPLPEDVVERTRATYVQAYETLTGCHLQL